MRISYRHTDNKEYWQKRWQTIEVDQPMSDTTKYPLCFALPAVQQNPNGLILEALERAIGESFRVLKHGGRICASFRADNIQERILDFIRVRETAPARPNKSRPQEMKFHKLNLTSSELHDLFARHGFEIESIVPVQNMPFLYKFRFFRAKQHKEFNEALAGKKDID